MTDIVERLREHNEPPFDYIAHEAATEIQQLRRDRKLDFELMDTFVKEINRLKRVLRLIASMESDPEFGVPPMATAQKIAQDALEDG
jgi:hypothetical protein